MKHDFVASGSLAFIFFGKHLTFKSMLEMLERDKHSGHGGKGGATGVEGVGSDRDGGDVDSRYSQSAHGGSQAAELPVYEGAGNYISGESAQTIMEIAEVRLNQMRENYRFAMSKASRFLDTSLKVSELEHRERIFDNEIDEAIHQREHEILQDQYYGTA